MRSAAAASAFTAVLQARPAESSRNATLFLGEGTRGPRCSELALPGVAWSTPRFLNVLRARSAHFRGFQRAVAVP